MKRLIAYAATVVLLGALVPATASAQSQFSDVRVVTNAGRTLAEHRQYTGEVVAQASRRADCFGEMNPSSHRHYRLTRPNVLGALIDAAANDRDLNPLLLTDAFFDDGFGFGVCDIGGVETSGFSYWYSAQNGVGATTGPDLIPVENGDDNLWYLTTGDEAGFPSELVVDSPARVIAGEAFEVTVTRRLADGTTEPASDVVVGGMSTNGDGKAQLTLDSGRTQLVANGGPDDVDSAEVRVCAGDTLSECPRRFGIRIFGSANRDRIRATNGKDKINCGRGRDVVTNVTRGDRIHRSCETVRRG